MLIDEILERKENFKKGSDEFFNGVYEDLKTEIKDIVLFNITNVAEYFSKITHKERCGLKTDFPNVAPPFNKMWLEWEVPKERRITPNKIIKDPLNGSIPRIGVNLFSMEIDEILPNLQEIYEEGKTVKWLMMAYVHLASDVPLPSSALIYIDENGKIIKMKNDGILILTNQDLDDKNRESTLYLFYEFLPEAFFAISLMHCNNVQIIKNEIIQKRKKGDGPRRIKYTERYHTLEIEGAKKMFSEEGDIENVGPQRAFHICRGNFAHYGPDKKLFGKFEGTVWRSQHVRGSKKVGRVCKDYIIADNVIPLFKK